MLDDWIEGKVHKVFGNINFSKKHFECEFLDHLWNTGNAMQYKLAKTNDKCTGDSPLTVSSYVGISQLTEWCLDNNANTNIYNNYNEHVLYIACIYNRHHIVCRHWMMQTRHISMLMFVIKNCIRLANVVSTISCYAF